jgi:hypothetical protein
MCAERCESSVFASSSEICVRIFALHGVEEKWRRQLEHRAIMVRDNERTERNQAVCWLEACMYTICVTLEAWTLCRFH